MADRSLRGARIGSHSLQREDGVILASRQTISYICRHCGVRTDVVFALEAEVPSHWECRGCGLRAAREGVEDAEANDPLAPAISGRTPWEMLLERRSLPELEDLLQERLKWLRDRRRSGDTL